MILNLNEYYYITTIKIIGLLILDLRTVANTRFFILNSY